MSSPQPLSSGGEHLSKAAWGALLVLCGALFLDALDVSMIGVALPSIKADLGMSTSSLQWVVSAYVLGYGGFLLLGGRAADLLGRRRMFLISLGVFIVASGLGGLTDDYRESKGGTDQVVGASVEQAFGRRVGKADRPVTVHDDDSIRQALDDSPEARLAGPRLCLGDHPLPDPRWSG